MFGAMIVILFFEWLRGGSLNAFPLLFLGAGMLSFFWIMPLGWRIASGVAVGMAMDSVSLFVPATYAISFLLLGYGIELLRDFFSNADSYVTRAVGTGVAVILFLIGVPLVSSFLGVIV